MLIKKTEAHVQFQMRRLVLRALVGTFLAVFTIFAAFFFIFDSLTFEKRQSALEDHMRSVSGTLSWSINSWFDSKVDKVESIHDVLQTRHDLPTIQSIIENDDVLPDMRFTFFGNVNGDFYLNRGSVPDTYDPRIRPWFKQAMQSDKAIVTDAYFTREELYILTIAKKVIIDGEFVGVFGADLSLNQVIDHFVETYEEGGFDLTIADRTGQIIVSSRGEPPMTRLDDIFADVDIGNATGIHYPVYHGNKVLAAISTIKNPHGGEWTLALTSRQNAGYHLANRLGGYAFYLTMFAGFLIFVVSSLVLHFLMIRPLHRSRLAQVKAGLRLKELNERLADHRDTLQAEVRQRTAELEQQTLKLEQALDSERELNQMQNEFVSMVSHEFRTPLTIIGATSRRIGKYVETRKYDLIASKVENIDSAIKRMTNLVETTLDSARVASGRMTIDPTPFDLKSLAVEVHARFIEISPNHVVQLQVSDDLPEEIIADRRLMDHVISNILSNAIKYSPEETQVELKLKRIGGQVELTCRDQGVGIPKEELSRLSERFFRASTSVGIPGTGIGLNLVRSLVEMHGGVLQIDSEEGAWTEVSVTLPIDCNANLPDTEESDVA